MKVASLYFAALDFLATADHSNLKPSSNSFTLNSTSSSSVFLDLLNFMWKKLELLEPAVLGLHSLAWHVYGVVFSTAQLKKSGNFLQAVVLAALSGHERHRAGVCLWAKATIHEQSGVYLALNILPYMA